MLNQPWSQEYHPNFDLAVVIGRFQPVHNGHLRLFEEAKRISKRQLVIVGSSFIARDSRNPFTFMERVDMIESVFNSNNLTIEGIADNLYNDQQWLADIQGAIDGTISSYSEDPTLDLNTKNIVIIGYKKDDTTSYLNWFPKYQVWTVPNYNGSDGAQLDATSIRRNFFTSDQHNFLKENVPESISSYLLGDWKNKNPYIMENIRNEFKFLDSYKSQFAGLKYPPIFVTTDAVVICHGHILLVKRRSHPGKGLWALPGGFLGTNETVKDSMFRELYEETKIALTREQLNNYLKSIHVFDAPGRSLRGRTITHAGLIVLESPKLPRVKGSDDAEVAKWFSLSDFYDMRDKTFEDHWSVGVNLINKI